MKKPSSPFCGWLLCHLGDSDRDSKSGRDQRLRAATPGRLSRSGGSDRAPGDSRPGEGRRQPTAEFSSSVGRSCDIRGEFSACRSRRGARRPRSTATATSVSSAKGDAAAPSMAARRRPVANGVNRGSATLVNCLSLPVTIHGANRESVPGAMLSTRYSPPRPGPRPKRRRSRLG